MELLQTQPCQKWWNIFTGPTDIQVTFELYGHFRCLQVFSFKQSYFYQVLSQWISKLPGSLEIHWVKQHLVNFMSLAGKVNTTFHKTEPIFKSWVWQLLLNFNTKSVHLHKFGDSPHSCLGWRINLLIRFTLEPLPFWTFVVLPAV